MIINNLVGQASAMQGNGAGNVAKPTAAEATKSFGEFLDNAIESVDSQEKNVQKLTDKFIIGQADVSEVMVASQQAELSLQLTTQVRNKVIEAYQEIMRMQV